MTDKTIIATKADNNLVPKQMPDEFCNARKAQATGDGPYCKRPAGWGTDHPVGRCKLHGGLSPKYDKTVMMQAYRSLTDTGLSSPKTLRDRAADFLDDPDMTDLSRELAGLRALQESLTLQLTNGETRDFEAAKMLREIADTIGRIATRHEEITRGKRYVIPISKVVRWADGIREILERNVEDPELLSKIADEIQNLSKRDEDYPD